MINDERIADFIRSFGQDLPTRELREIEEEAQRDHVPIIRKETQEFLRVLLEIKRPKRILEVGAAIGFSSVFMGQVTDDAARITTIENYPPRIARAKSNIAMAGMEDKIQLLEGDAAEILPTLSGPYDLVFMDAAKGQYIHFLKEVKRVMEDGSILLSDNVLQDGDVFESRYGIRRRNHTIHKRMREYLYTLTHDRELDTVILNNGDGVALSVYQESAIKELI